MFYGGFSPELLDGYCSTLWSLHIVTRCVHDKEKLYMNILSESKVLNHNPGTITEMLWNSWPEIPMYF